MCEDFLPLSALHQHDVNIKNQKRTPRNTLKMLKCLYYHGMVMLDLKNTLRRVSASKPSSGSQTHVCFSCIFCIFLFLLSEFFFEFWTVDQTKTRHINMSAWILGPCDGLFFWLICHRYNNWSVDWKIWVQYQSHLKFYLRAFHHKILWTDIHISCFSWAL